MKRQMKVKRESSGYYEVRTPLGNVYCVLRNTELAGPDKWIAYDTRKPDNVLDPLPTKAAVLQVLKLYC